MLEFPTWKKLLVAAVFLATLYTAAPNLFPLFGKPVPSWLPQGTLSLGLDLQGGSHLQLEVDVATYQREQMENLVGEVRRSLREAGLGYQNLRAKDGTVRFAARQGDSAEDYTKVMNELDPRLAVAQEGKEWVLRFKEAELLKSRKQLLEQSIEIVRRRVDETGTREPIIQQQGDSRIILQVPGMDDPEHLKRLLGKTARLSFHLVVEPGREAEGGSRVLRMQEGGGTIRVERQPLLTGDQLSNASAAYEKNEPIVSFSLNRQGAKRFGRITTEHVGQPFAIVLDDEVISAPVIREPILGGSGMISGNFTAQSAGDLALLLRAGALPAPLAVVEQRTVGPSLGEDSVQSGVRAFLLGLVLIVGLMLVYYRRAGFFAVLALIMNKLMIIALMSVLGATLTLPGIAGLVLGIGMAVDANVLIFERIKEELRGGKKIPAAVGAGFHHAFGTILDSNITALIAAVILFQMGAGPVRGFAVTLILGIITSMFTSIMLTRMLLIQYVLKGRPKQLSI